MPGDGRAEVEHVAIGDRVRVGLGLVEVRIDRRAYLLVGEGLEQLADAGGFGHGQRRTFGIRWPIHRLTGGPAQPI
jgi:hypothetical protein